MRNVISVQVLARLTQIVAQNFRAEEAIHQLVESALQLTRSRNAMLAIVNDEAGEVVVRYGAGADVTKDALPARLQVQEGEGFGIVAAAAAKGKAVRVGDVSTDPRYHRLFETSRSEIAVPVRDRFGRVRAVLNVESDEKDHYSDSEQRVCESIGNLLSVVIERGELLRREEALMQIGSILDRSESEDELLDKVLHVGEDVLEFHSFSVFLYDRERDLFMLRGTIGSLKDRVGVVGYAGGEGLTGWVCANAQPLLVHDPQSDPRWLGRFLELPAGEISSYLAVPIESRGRTIGALRLIRRKSENKYIDNRFTEDDQRLLAAISDQLSAGLENVRSMQKALQIERMAAWGEMSAKSSHMIGNRIFAIKGEVNELGYLLDEEPLSKVELKQVLENLRNNIGRIDEIMQDFRDYVTAAQVSRVRADLNFLVRDAVMEVFPKRSQIKLELLLQDSLPEVQVDANRMRRAIGEIVENALNYYESGQFTVATRSADTEEVRAARLPTAKAYVAIEFSDQGPGVPQDDKEKIFQPFYSSRVKGMGLGLSIVRGILEGHGGTVREVGEPGCGAKFLFLIPVDDRQ